MHDDEGDAKTVIQISAFPAGAQSYTLPGHQNLEEQFTL